MVNHYHQGGDTSKGIEVMETVGVVRWQFRHEE
jgi:hypothetical protein